MHAAELSGRVIGYPDGEPLAFVSMMVVDPTGRPVVVQADAEGIWEAEDLPSGRYRVRAVPPHSLNRIGSWFGDTWSFCPADVVSLASSDRVETLLHELPAGGWLDGRVTDALGDPVAGATIRATGLDFYNSATTREAQSDGDGDYSVSGLDSITLDGEPVAGHYRVGVSAPGLATWYHPGTWNSGDATPVEARRGETAVLDLALPELVSLSGRLLDAGGEGLPALPLRATAQVGGSAQVRTTDAEGFFLFDALSGTDFELQVDASGFARTLLADSVAGVPGEQVDLGSFVLEPEAVLQGELEGMDVFEGSRLLLLDPQTGWEGASSVLEPSLATYRFEGVPAGEWSVELRPATSSLLLPGPVSTAGGEPATLTLAAGETAELDLLLVVGAGLRGSVRRRAGAPLPGAVVSVTDQDGVELSGARTRTDDSGWFELLRLPPGERFVRAEYTPFCAGDPAWVERYWPSGRGPDEASEVPLAAATTQELDTLVMPPDRDRDAMDDVWELAWGLDPSRDDGSEDPDLDGRSNRQEYVARTDPLDRLPDPGCSARLAGRDPGGPSRGGALTCALGLLLAGLRLRCGAPRQDRGRRGGRPTASRPDDAGTELSG